MSRFYLFTYGCQMNRAEARQVASLLEERGWRETARLAEADLVVINSCSVRQGSEDKVYGLGQKLLPWKERRRGRRVVLTGCLVGSAQGERQRLSLARLESRLPWVDEFIGIDDLLARFSVSQRGGAEDKETYLLPISQGCDNFCSYCVVPYSRGKEVSRSEEEIVCEARQALARGYRHLTLLGQNVNSYGKPSPGLVADPRAELPFSRLLKKVHRLPKLDKLSFLTLNPYDINQELIATLALPKIDRRLHLPVQSGDDEILRRMNRRYTVAEYKELVKRIRLAIPQVRISADLIVGFPGETREQFENTVSLVREIGFSQIFVGIYSPRKGTLAEKFGDPVPLAEKKARHHRVMAVWREGNS